MAEQLDADTRLKIYLLVLNRYKDFISEKESLSISEIRQRVSPYNDYVRKMRETVLADMVPYDPKQHFLAAAGRAMDHVRKMRTCEFAFTFWMDFREMEELKIGTAMDKAILLAALLRSLESRDARVLVTKKGRALVRFSWNEITYLFVTDSGSLLMGEDTTRLVGDDPIAYSFNDLVYENYEEQ